MSHIVELSHLDHLVLTVKDIDVSVNFYVSVLGMKEVVFKQGRVALQFGGDQSVHQKINLHQLGNEFEPKAENVRQGSADLCFIASSPVCSLIKKIEDAGVDIIEGPVNRTGAVGNIQSIYFRDPDGNLIELSNYT